MGEINGPVLTGRRSLLLGMAALAAAALSGCGGPAQDVPPPGSTPATPPPAPPLPADVATPAPSVASAAGTPTAEPARPAPPSKEQIVSEFSGRRPQQWGLHVSGVVNGSAAKQVALTFDACGGSGGSGCDQKLLGTLRALNIPATLFVNQRWIEANQALTRELGSDPLFELANHGFLHRPLSVNGRSAYGIAGTADVGQVYDELMGNQSVLQGMTGGPARFFRPGTAFYDEVAAAITRRVGLLPVNFTVNGDAGATFPAATVAAEVGRVVPGDIVISHFNKPGSGTAAGYAQVLPRLLGQGITFAKLGSVLPL
ncbi:polysaccharide deacetylase family protein [Pseudarthrobacter sp. N5]|uniref:polysaccharide deacetylase family protein n=1 Tax=Pseudarthrobacter sp. N5 TaxID=3418416 RepID=UPI003CE824D8